MQVTTSRFFIPGGCQPHQTKTGRPVTSRDAGSTASWFHLRVAPKFSSSVELGRGQCLAQSPGTRTHHCAAQRATRWTRNAVPASVPLGAGYGLTGRKVGLLMTPGPLVCPSGNRWFLTAGLAWRMVYKGPAEGWGNRKRSKRDSFNNPRPAPRQFCQDGVCPPSHCSVIRQGD